MPQYQNALKHPSNNKHARNQNPTALPISIYLCTMLDEVSLCNSAFDRCVDPH